MPESISSPEATCHQCLLENLKSKTVDATTVSDVGRPHRSYGKGVESTKSHRTGMKESFALPRKTLLTREDFDHWFAEIGKHMAPSTLAVYSAGISKALRGLRCDHGGWGCDLGASTSATTFANPVGPIGPFAGTDFLLEAERVGFKMSVCQKSMSLALKHAYARGIIPLPPVCPVDRIVLNLATTHTGQAWFTNWTEVNDIPTYESHLNHLIAAANKWELKLAEWEILGFESQLPSLFEVEQAGWQLDRKQLESRLEIARGAFLRRFGGPENDPNWIHSMLVDALKSSLQHNPTYSSGASEQDRAEVRSAMRSFLRGFIARWGRRPIDELTIELFQAEMLQFQSFMNDAHGASFR